MTIALNEISTCELFHYALKLNLPNLTFRLSYKRIRSKGETKSFAPISIERHSKMPEVVTPNTLYSKALKASAVQLYVGLRYVFSNIYIF